MRTAIAGALSLALAAVGTTASAATEQLAITAQFVVTELGEEIALPDGRKLRIGMQNHAAVVNDQTGEVTSQWCSGHEHLDAAGASMATAGYCTVFYDSGDVLWLSFTGTTNDQPGTWTVMGGLGKYVGATGGGTFKTTSMRSDGFALTQTGTGTVTTK